MRRLSVLFALMLCAIGASHCAPADNYPNRPITIVMGTSKGGVTDVVTRLYADAASKALGQPVVIDNRPSDSGEEAAAFVQRAAPDGYTLLVFSGAQHLAVPQMRSVDYEPLTGFAPVTALFTLVNFLAVPAMSPAKSVEDLLRIGKERRLTFGSAGMGSTSHLAAAQMTLDLGKSLAPVPVHYAGAAPMISDLVAGRFDFALVSYTVAKPYVADGQLRLLALDAADRWPDLPDLPTLSEAAPIDEERVASWFGLAAPNGTPQAVLDKLYAAFASAMRDPKVAQTLHENGVIPASTPPAQTRAMMVREAANMSLLVPILNPR